MNLQESIERVKRIRSEFEQIFAMTSAKCRNLPSLKDTFDKREQDIKALAYLLSVAKRVDILSIKNILNDTCQTCIQRIDGCYASCSILTNKICEWLDNGKI